MLFSSFVKYQFYGPIKLVFVNYEKCSKERTEAIREYFSSFPLSPPQLLPRFPIDFYICPFHRANIDANKKNENRRNMQMGMR